MLVLAFMLLCCEEYLSCWSLHLCSSVARRGVPVMLVLAFMLLCCEEYLAFVDALTPLLRGVPVMLVLAFVVALTPL